MFTQDQMGRIAQKLGFNGPADKFGEFLASNPAANRAYTGLHNKVNMKFNRGGVVSMAVGGFTEDQYKAFGNTLAGLSPADAAAKVEQERASLVAQGRGGEIDPSMVGKFINPLLTTAGPNSPNPTVSNPTVPFNATPTGSSIVGIGAPPAGVTAPAPAPAPAPAVADPMNIMGSNDITGVRSGTDTQMNKLLVGDDGLSDLGRFKQNLLTKDPSGRLFKINETVEGAKANKISNGNIYLMLEKEGYSPEEIIEATGAVGKDAAEINSIANVRSAVAPKTATDVTFANTRNGIVRVEPGQKIPPYSTVTDSASYLAQEQKRMDSSAPSAPSSTAPPKVFTPGDVRNYAEGLKGLSLAEAAKKVAFDKAIFTAQGYDPDSFRIEQYITPALQSMLDADVAPTAKSTTFVQTADGLVEIPAGETIPEGKVVFEDVLGTGVTLERVKKEQAFQAAPDYVFIKLADGSVERIKKGDPVPDGEQVGVRAWADSLQPIGTPSSTAGAVGDETAAALGAETAAVPSPADGPFAPGFFYRTEGGELGKEYSKEAAEERGTLISEKDLNFLGGLSPELVVLNGIIFDKINSGTDNVTLFNELTEKGYTKEEIIKATGAKDSDLPFAKKDDTTNINLSTDSAGTLGTDTSDLLVDGATATATATTVDANGNPIPATTGLGESIQDYAFRQTANPALPIGGKVVAEGIDFNENTQKIADTKGQVATTDPSVDTADEATTTQASAPTALTANTFAASKAGELTATTAKTGTFTNQITASTMEPKTSEVANQNAEQIGSAVRVTAPSARAVSAQELVSAPADAVTAAEFADAVQAATAQPSTAATVQGQLANLMADFEGGATPTWAAGAMRHATAIMAQRGLSASSMAGQAIVQAAMESALPIATADAQVMAQFEFQNLSNRQARAMLSAQQRAVFIGQEFDQQFQARVQNASRISDIANLNFNAEQQIALENSKMAQTVDLTNIGNKQAVQMANIAQIAQLETINLSNRQQASVQNAQSFLQMDLANLSNEQQAVMFDSQAKVQTLLSDQAADNAAKQFNATSKNQVNQFFANLSSQVSQFNATQSNAMEQFNIEQEVAVDKFNTDIENQRDQFNAQNELIIAQSNATWRRDIATADTVALNEANMVNAKSILDISEQSYANLWQTFEDIMEYSWSSAEKQLDRYNQLAYAKLQTDNSIALAELRNDATASSGFGSLIGTVASGFLAKQNIISLPGVPSSPTGTL